MTVPSQEEPLISFDQPTYAPGEVVHGKVIFALKERLPDSLRLLCRGEERVRKRHMQTKIYRDTVVTKAFLYGVTREWSGDNFSAGFGVYSIPFTFQLPRDIADSRLFDDGDALREIRYFVQFKSSYHNGDHYKTIESMKLFRVRNPAVPSQITSISKSASSGSARWCFGNRKLITGQLSLDKGAYPPGETVKFRGFFSQTTAGLIRGIKAEFGYKLQENGQPDRWLSIESRTLSRPAVNLNSNSIEPTVVEFEVTVPEETGLRERRCYFINLEAETEGALIPFNIYVDVHSDESPEVATVDLSIPVTYLNVADFSWQPVSGGFEYGSAR